MMERPRILVTSSLPGRVESTLDDVGEVTVLRGEGRLPRGELLRHLPGAHAVLTILTDRMDREAIEAGGSLRIIANCAVGYDNIDIGTARERGIVVTNTPDVLTEATADLTWALILAASRRIVPADRYVREGRFTTWLPGLFLGSDLSGKTLGVVGAGRIGRAVARRASGFGMGILYADPRPVQPSDERALAARRVSLEELLEESDIVTIHVPLSPGTRHLIAGPQLGRMKPGAYLVNTSRGPVVDEEALVKALEAGRIAGAGLDVYEEEPKVHRGLLGREDVVLLPHIGSATVETRERMAELAARNVAAVLRGEKPVTPVV